MSPYAATIVGEEDFVYVWMLGTQGVGNEQDKLVVITGGIASENLDPLIRPVGPNSSEVDDLPIFMHSLTGDNIDANVADGFAAAVGNR